MKTINSYVINGKILCIWLIQNHQRYIYGTEQHLNSIEGYSEIFPFLKDSTSNSWSRYLKGRGYVREFYASQLEDNTLGTLGTRRKLPLVSHWLKFDSWELTVLDSILSKVRVWKFILEQNERLHLKTLVWKFVNRWLCCIFYR